MRYKCARLKNYIRDEYTQGLYTVYKEMSANMWCMGPPQSLPQHISDPISLSLSGVDRFFKFQQNIYSVRETTNLIIFKCTMYL